MSLLPYSPLLLPLAGYAVESWCRRRDRRAWPAPGQLVDVGGHRLHARSYGAGPLVVVFEADEGAWSTHWGSLPERFAPDARVIVYDRAGLGWSDPGPEPRDGESLARELHQMLRKLVPDPKRRTVLVAHGSGAHVARVYAHRYPFETAGVVLVDPHPDTLRDRLRREQVEAPEASPLAIHFGNLLARLGVVRLLSWRGGRNGWLPLPAKQRRLLDAFELDPRVRRAAAQELAAEARTLEQVQRASDLGAPPTHVLVSRETLAADRVPRTFPRAEFNRLWAEEGARIAGAVRAGTLSYVDEADHLLQLHAPEPVEAAVREVLEQCQSESAQQS